jgi:hypothetical protein
VEVGRQEKISRIRVRMTPTDMRMVELVRRAGFDTSLGADFWEATLSP